VQSAKNSAQPLTDSHNVAVFEKTKFNLAQKEILGAPKKGSALKDDAFHKAADDFKHNAAKGRHFSYVGGDKTVVNLTQVEGEFNGYKGIFEWIVDKDGNLTHQVFIKNGEITGIPNMQSSKLKKLKKDYSDTKNGALKND
jgi:hypothetical protein